MKIRKRIIGGALLALLSGCATNGEIGFAHHPADCAMGVGHSDCLPGAAGYARYQSEGNTVSRE